MADERLSYARETDRPPFVLSLLDPGGTVAFLAGAHDAPPTDDVERARKFASAGDAAAWWSGEGQGAMPGVHAGVVALEKARRWCAGGWPRGEQADTSRYREGALDAAAGLI